MEMNGDGKNCSGFSLLEVLIAMVILTVGLLAGVALFETGMKALQGGNKWTVGIELAQNKMELLRATNVASLQSGMDELQGMTRSWSVRKSEKDSRIWLIQVDVVWKDSLSRRQIVSLKTFVFF